MGNACLLPFLRKLPTVQSFQTYYVFLCVPILFSSGSSPFVCCVILCLPYVFSLNSCSLVILQQAQALPSSESLPWISRLGSGSACLQMSHPEQQPSISLCSGHWRSEDDCFLFCLQPLLIKCEVVVVVVVFPRGRPVLSSLFLWQSAWYMADVQWMKARWIDKKSGLHQFIYLWHSVNV